jgi:hypothetical protein
MGFCDFYEKLSDSSEQELGYCVVNAKLHTVSVKECSTSISGDLKIPHTVNHDGITYLITAIKNAAFEGCRGLTSVTIPDSVTEIGEEGEEFWGRSVFGGCSSLTSVTIPNSVTDIWPCAFCGCSGLTSITIPDSVTLIARDAFADCSSLTSVTIGNSVTKIGKFAFYGCSGLTSVTIPDSVTEIAKVLSRVAAG